MYYAYYSSLEIWPVGTQSVYMDRPFKNVTAVTSVYVIGI